MTEIEQQQQTTTTDASDDAPPPSADMLIKHPLQHSWTLWYLESDRTKKWEETQNIVTTFDTVEDFWSLFNHIKQPAEIKVGNDYSLFKAGIRPMWEDEANNRGGRWTLTLNRSQREELNKLWLDTVLCLIGEAFDHSEDICGAVVNVRAKGDKISIWTAEGNNNDAILEIGNKLKDRLGLGPKHELKYHLHADTMVKTGSQAKAIYSL